MEALSVKNLTIQQNNTTIIDALSFSVKAGELCGLLGSNGSGKTSILHAIAGFLPYEGSIAIQDKENRLLSESARASLLAYVAQGSIPAMQTVEERVMLGRYSAMDIWGRYAQEDRDICAQSMSSLAIDSYAKRRLCTLSGGEQQRVDIARAFAQKTPILVLDEPTSALDSRYALHVMGVLQNISHSGVACIMSIHDINIASLFCDTVCLLKDGIFLAQGTPYDVITEENIFAVYGVSACIFPHPLYGVPQVVLQYAK